MRSGGGRSSPSAGTGLSKPSRPPWSPRPPSESPSRFRLPQPMHILTRERGARPETPSVKVCLLPGPHYIYPSSLPPSSSPDHIRPPSLTSRLIPSAFPTKLLALPAASPTASAGDLPSGVSAPARTSPGPGLDGREVSGYRGPLISFGTFPDWQEVENLNSCRPPAPGPRPRAPASPSDPRGGSSHLQRRAERPRTKRLWDPGPTLPFLQRMGRGPARPPGFRLRRSLPTAHLRARHLRRQLSPTRVSATSRLRAAGADSPRTPTLLAPQPLAQPPPLGKTNPGGGGEPGLPEGFLPPRGQPWQPSVGGFKKGDWGELGRAPPPGGNEQGTCRKR